MPKGANRALDSRALSVHSSRECQSVHASRACQQREQSELASGKHPELATGVAHTCASELAPGKHPELATGIAHCGLATLSAHAI